MEYILDVTSFKSKAPWAEDPYKEVPAKVKAAFTRWGAAGQGTRQEDGYRRQKARKHSAAVVPGCITGVMLLASR